MAVSENLGVLFLAVSVVLVQAVPRIVDLSHIQSKDATTWPGNPSYNFTILFRGFAEQYGFWLENNHFSMPEHMGTHVDAPVHTVKGMWKTHQIPVEKLHGAGVIIDVKAKVKANPDYRVMVDDLMKWEKKFGEIPRHAIIIMNSGWSDKYPNKTLIFGSNQHDNPSSFHFPSWHVDAVTWLINKRQINAVGVDTPSTDYGQAIANPNYPRSCHVTLGENNVIGIENVANLDKVPETGSTIYMPVLKIFDGSGGPARVFATYDDEPNKTNAASTFTSFPRFVFLFEMILMCTLYLIK